MNLKNDTTTTIMDFRKELKKFVEERDWNQYHTAKSLAIALNIEAAELLEIFLFKSDGYIPENLTSLTDEMADVFIYLLNLVNSLNIENFTEIVKQKIIKNAKKYPIDKFSSHNYKKQ
ncbi:MAG: nucleotide pyrophosphohydrolase [Promethearchaeota archaeon]